MSDLQKVLHVFALVVYIVNVSAVLSSRYQCEVLDIVMRTHYVRKMKNIVIAAKPKGIPASVGITQCI